MADDGRQRIDKWLFFARLAKSRSLGAKLVALGRVRINRAKAELPSATVKPGDVLTVNLDRRIAVVRVTGLGERRGPALEARGLYEDLSSQDLTEGRASPLDGAESVRLAPWPDGRRQD